MDKTSLRKTIRDAVKNGNLDSIKPTLRSLGVSDSEIDSIAYSYQSSSYPEVNDKGVPVVVSPDNFDHFCKVNNLEFGYVLDNQVVWINGEPRIIDDKLFSQWLTKAQREGWKPGKDNFQMWITQACCADQTEYEYFRKFANQKPWDGKDRFPELYNLLNSPDQDDFAKLTFKKWVHGLVALATDTPMPGESTSPRNEIVLILKGPEGIGKTQFCRGLLPPSPVTLIKEGPLDTGSKDHKVDITKHLLWILSEIEASLSKQGIGQVKDFLTMETPNERPAYGRFNSTARKVCSFIGSTNDHRFLPPGQELRRFSVIETPKEINYNHNLDVQQIWAQCLYERSQGFQNWFARSKGEIEANYKRISKYIIPDSLNLFFEKYTYTEDGERGIPEGDLWTRYVKFCKHRKNQFPQSHYKTFTERLIQEGYVKEQKVPGKASEYNIKLKEEKNEGTTSGDQVPDL